MRGGDTPTDAGEGEAMSSRRIAVCLEVTPTMTFASALDWPGWCRAGGDEAAALRALAGYAERYAPVAEQARVGFPSTVAFDVVERVFTGRAAEGPSGRRPGSGQADRPCDRRRHDLYAQARGEFRPPAFNDIAAIEELREATAAVVGAPSDGSPVVPNGWTTRYASRRITWRVLEHAWEMQDRAES
jgi:hypothetical protein